VTERRSDDLLDDDGFYNPLDERNLARGVANALISQPVHAFGIKPFAGTGVYALYYLGDFPTYQPLVALCAQGGTPEHLGLGPDAVPIYVGKASASASRGGTLKPKHNRALYTRLGSHRLSIRRATKTLDPADFRLRYIPMKDVWVALGEAGLLQRYTPIWNVVLSGLGNNNPGGGRGDQARSAWDTLHPGRPAAMKLPENPESLASIEARVERAIAAIIEGRDLPEDTLTVDEDPTDDGQPEPQ
jgi:Eco29kI restriction endonuclease